MKEINVRLIGEAIILAIGLTFAADSIGSHIERGLEKINIQIINGGQNGTGK